MHKTTPILAMLATACGLALADPGAPLYKSPISDAMNVRFVENHIVVDRPAKDVFDWVTTWGNLHRWLPVAQEVEALKGPLDKPSQLGDVLVELVDPARTNGVSKQYTVVAHVDGLLWTVAGQDLVDGKPNPRVQYVATFLVTPLQDGRSLFVRQFQLVRPDISNPAERRPVDDPEVIQRGLVNLKRAVEAALPRS
jgi:hypothetical protein